MSNKNPYKPFKTIEEQISILKNEKNIDAINEDFAKEVLFSTSYYTLVNGYSKMFIDPNSEDVCIEGTSIEILHLLYTLDTDICSIINKNILKVEQTLKTLISYRVGEKIGDTPYYYLNFSNYTQNSLYDFKQFKKAANKALGIKWNGEFYDPVDKSILHYVNNYQRDNVPPWILSNGLTLGPTINWYNSLKPEDKNWVCLKLTRHLPEDINLKDRLEFLKTSLKLLHESRNNISHSRRVLIQNSEVQIPKLTLFNIINDSILTEYEYNSKLGQKGLYAIIIVLYLLLYDEYQLNGFHFDLSLILNNFSNIKLINDLNPFNLIELPSNIGERINLLYDLR